MYNRVLSMRKNSEKSYNKSKNIDIKIINK